MVYVVDGSSGGQYGGGPLDHPAMYYSVLTAGSLIVDIDGQRLDATFLSANGTKDDTFTIFKGDLPNGIPPAMKIARAGTNTVVSWPTSNPDYRLESKSSLDISPWSPVAANIFTNGRSKSVSVPIAVSNQFFRLRNQP
jgi:hypothetical protein